MHAEFVRRRSGTVRRERHSHLTDAWTSTGPRFRAARAATADGCLLHRPLCVQGFVRTRRVLVRGRELDSGVVCTSLRTECPTGS